MECFLNSCIFLDKLHALVKVDSTSKSMRARANTKSDRTKRIYKVDHVKHFIVWFQSRITMMIIKRKKEEEEEKEQKQEEKEEAKEEEEENEGGGEGLILISKCFVIHAMWSDLIYRLAN